MKWMKFFQKKTPPDADALRCGGSYSVSIVDKHDNVLGQLWYRMPTSDERLTYIWAMQEGLSSESNLRKIADEKTPANMARKIHEVTWHELAIPSARLIFERCTGFRDADGKSIDGFSREAQLDFLEKFHALVLVKLTEIAFKTEYSLKKN